jgi:hypothetical protein
MGCSNESAHAAQHEGKKLYISRRWLDVLTIRYDSMPFILFLFRHRQMTDG